MSVRVEHVMGTVFSLDLRTAPDSWAGAESVDEVIRWWHWVDEVFSTYRTDSQISRLGRGEVTLGACAPEVAEILDLCARASQASEGYFTAMPGGVLDPSGMVKGWSVERGSAMLAAAGSTAHAVNGGGDVRCHGSAGPDVPWQVGIADPTQPGATISVVSGHDLAVATSGTAERGCHVVNPFTGRPADALASVTIVGPDLIWADAYATAALAMGDRCRSWVTGLAGYEALVVGTDGRPWHTAGWPGTQTRWPAA